MTRTSEKPEEAEKAPPLSVYSVYSDVKKNQDVAMTRTSEKPEEAEKAPPLSVYSVYSDVKKTRCCYDKNIRKTRKHRNKTPSVYSVYSDVKKKKSIRCYFLLPY